MIPNIDVYQIYSSYSLLFIMSTITLVLPIPNNTYESELSTGHLLNSSIDMMNPYETPTSMNNMLMSNRQSSLQYNASSAEQSFYKHHSSSNGRFSLMSPNINSPLSKSEQYIHRYPTTPLMSLQSMSSPLVSPMLDYRNQMNRFKSPLVNSGRSGYSSMTNSPLMSISKSDPRISSSTSLVSRSPFKSPTMYNPRSKSQSPILLKTKAKPIKNTHLIFDLCNEMEEDPEWKHILSDATRNKFPRGFWYRNQILTFYKKKKSINLNLKLNYETLTSEDFMEDELAGYLEKIKEFFIEHTGIHTTMDIALSKKQNEVNRKVRTWKNITRKATRNNLIDQYARRYAKIEQLTKDQGEQLLDLIRFGFYQKMLESSNITFNGEYITDITGFIWSNPENRFIINSSKKMKKSKSMMPCMYSDEKLLDPSKKNVSSHVQPNFDKNWSKYMETMKVKIVDVDD